MNLFRYGCVVAEHTPFVLHKGKIAQSPNQNNLPISPIEQSEQSPNRTIELNLAVFKTTNEEVEEVKFMYKNELATHDAIKGVARLSSSDEMSCFSFGGRNIRFRTSPRLTRYKKVLSWEKGFIEVLAQYGDKVEEEYIDLVSILENLYIDPESYLSSLKKVEVENV